LLQAHTTVRWSGPFPDDKGSDTLCRTKVHRSGLQDLRALDPSHKCSEAKATVPGQLAAAEAVRPCNAYYPEYLRLGIDLRSYDIREG